MYSDNILPIMIELFKIWDLRGKTSNQNQLKKELLTNKVIVKNFLNFESFIEV